MDLKIGDVVELKSGGPAMTVESIENNRVWCAWFINGETNRAVFASDMLQEPQEPPSVTWQAG